VSVGKCSVLIRYGSSSGLELSNLEQHSVNPPSSKRGASTSGWGLEAADVKYLDIFVLSMNNAYACCSEPGYVDF
jgi:hypothetical protein